MSSSARIQQLLDFLQREPDDVFLNYALGVEYMAGSDLEKARQQFEKVLKQDRDYIAAYYQLGKLYEALQKNSEALKCYKTGLEKARAQKNNKAVNEFGEAIFMIED
jgi:Tfp pilus assembly protein PilF